MKLDFLDICVYDWLVHLLLAFELYCSKVVFKMVSMLMESKEYYLNYSEAPT